MELDGRQLERLSYTCVQIKSGRNYVCRLFLNGDRETGAVEMLKKNAVVNRLQSIRAWKAESENAEVALQASVDGEGSSGLVHARNILSVGNLLQGELVTIVPMAVVQMLTNQSVWLDSEKPVSLVTNKCKTEF